MVPGGVGNGFDRMNGAVGVFWRGVDRVQLVVSVSSVDNVVPHPGRDDDCPVVLPIAGHSWIRTRTRSPLGDILVRQTCRGTRVHKWASPGDGRQSTPVGIRDWRDSIVVSALAPANRPPKYVRNPQAESPSPNSRYWSVEG